MTSVIDEYYKKVDENVDNLKIKFDISSLLVKSKDLILKSIQIKIIFQRI